MIVVIDYKAGNLYNVGNALHHLGVEFVFSGDRSVVEKASRVILPGVGSAKPAMESLDELGLVPVLRNLSVPFLGICLGLQLLFERSDEEQTACLGVFPGVVKRFDSTHFKVPHIGWNQVTCESPTVLLQQIPDSSNFYFVHSYYAPLSSGLTKGTTDYGDRFSSVAAKNNYCGVQFHPERSGELGLQVLRNFLEAIAC
ncbi:MAG: imidazole glycerol phosphate synthase subunit HisH [Acidobacteria bacterium]|nr:MAG: imidazole glycerol phosphate synthase subunit HisH [Acidobacteriota bacterium]